MENFVSGILISNNPHVVYEGSVFDRSLRFQLDNGQILRLFDQNAVSEDLVVGERYQVIAEPLISAYLHYIEEGQDLSSEKGVIHGKIRNLSWTPPKSPHIYHVVDESDFYEGNHRFILVETSYGTIIFGLDVVERETKLKLEELKIGGFLEWKESRFDFVGALDPLA